MLISDLIKELNSIKTKFGDIEITISDKDTMERDPIFFMYGEIDKSEMSKLVL